MNPSCPESRIASLSAGEFVGMVADLAGQPIEQKMFCCRIRIDIDAVKAEEDAYQPLPIVKEVTTDMLEQNYRQVKTDIRNMILAERDRISNDLELRHLIIE